MKEIVKTIQNRKNKMKKNWKDCLRNQRNSRRDLIGGKDLQIREESDQIFLRKVGEKVNLWIYRENGPGEKIQEIQEEEKVEIGQDTSGE